MEYTVYGLIMVLGLVFVVPSAALHRQQIRLKVSPAERVGLRYALEFTLAAIFFALLGLWINDPSGVMLRLESLLMSGFIALQMVRAINNARRFGARNRLTLWLMLAISAFFFTIEVVNAVWFSESRFYLYGLLCIVTLGALQMAAVMVDAHAQTSQTFRPRGAFLRRSRRQRVPSDGAAGDSDRAPQPHAYIDNHRLPYH